MTIPWTLDETDHRLLDTRRHTDTWLGLALQLCALRYPGRLIQRGEMIPSVALAFIADQLGLEPDVLTNFARRSPTRYEQLAILHQTYGFKDLTHPDREDLLGWARGVAVATTKDKHVITALADEMRRRRITIPASRYLNGWRRRPAPRPRKRCSMR